ncbi:hypothetical protein Mapa_006287 [Marchantia paleacea]|nr:hypothetical protein Mapa_006287 [Marchantia paleacea]
MCQEVVGLNILQLELYPCFSAYVRVAFNHIGDSVYTYIHFNFSFHCTVSKKKDLDTYSIYSVATF